LCRDFKTDVLTETRNNLSIIVANVMRLELKLQSSTSISEVVLKDVERDINSIITRYPENRIEIFVGYPAIRCPVEVLEGRVAITIFPDSRIDLII
jgi:hypothetical protein